MAAKAVIAVGLVATAQGLAFDVAVAEGTEGQVNASSQKAGSCDCLSWGEVYYKNWAYCGRGNELYFLSKYGFSAAYAATEPISGLPHKICYDFFKNFLDNSCVNVDLYPFPESAPSSKNGEQWCYVSNGCTELNGGGFATNQQGFAQAAWHNQQSSTHQAWKKCAPGDNMLKSKPVPDVVALGVASDVSLSRLLRLAYPAVSISWGEASFFYEALNDEYEAGLSIGDMVAKIDTVSGWGSRIEEVHAKLRDIATSGQPTVLDSPGHGDNFHVVEGRAAYAVTRIPNGDMAYLGGHFSKEFKVDCVVGCAQAEQRNAVDLDTM